MRRFPSSYYLGVGGLALVIMLFFMLDSDVDNGLNSATIQKADDLKVVAESRETIVVTTTVTTTAIATSTRPSKPAYTPGKPDLSHNYQKALIVASIKKENTSWVSERLPWIDSYIYVNDDPTAALTVPKNKANEVMAYLTFIIDHYASLPEIMIFVHAHASTHHNPWISKSTAELVTYLNPHRVVRMGYVNLNCGTWSKDGDCHAQVRPVESRPYGWTKEIWLEMFPEYPLPQVLAQFCCAQFAVSRERVLQIPREKFVQMRDIILDTDIRVVGFSFEYMWQFLFAGEHVYCPKSEVCFCDGFGLCFGGNYGAYMRLQVGRQNLIAEIDAISERGKKALAEKTSLPEADVARKLKMQQYVKLKGVGSLVVPKVSSLPCVGDGPGLYLEQHCSREKTFLMCCLLPPELSQPLRHMLTC